MVELSTTRAIHKALHEHYLGRNAGVYCQVQTLRYSTPFTYEVLQARKRKGVLSVFTINGWEIPFRVFVRSQEEAEDDR